MRVDGGGPGQLSIAERTGGGRPAPSPAEPRSAPGAGRTSTVRSCTGGRKLRAAASTHQRRERTTMVPADSGAKRERQAGKERWKGDGWGGPGLLPIAERTGGGRPAPSPAEPRSAPGAGRASTGRSCTGGHKLRAAASTYQRWERTAMVPADSGAERERQAGRQRDIRSFRAR